MKELFLFFSLLLGGLSCNNSHQESRSSKPADAQVDAFFKRHANFINSTPGGPVSGSRYLNSWCRKPQTADEGPSPLVSYYCPPKPELSRKSSSRNGSSIRKIILHNTEEAFIDALGIFVQGEKIRPNGPGNRVGAVDTQVSIHFIVARDGTIIRNIKDNTAAHHSGNTSTNKESIGIEIEASLYNPNATIKAGGFTQNQYASFAKLVKHLKDTYSIPKSGILPHRGVVNGTLCPSSIWGKPEVDFFSDWKNVVFRGN